MAAELRMTGQGLQQDGGAGARQAADEDRLHDLSVRDVGRPHPRLEVGEPDPQARMARDEAPAVMHPGGRSEEHTSELQSLMRSSYAVLCLKKKQHKEKCSQT